MDNQLIKVVKRRKKSQKNSDFFNSEFKGTKDGLEILRIIENYWTNLLEIRRVRAYNRDFRNGKQWAKKEIQEILDVGGSPIVQNICAPIVKNLVGQYWSSRQSPVAVARKQDAAEVSSMLSLAMERAVKINDDEAKDSRNLEEIILGGVACCRVSYSWHEDINMNDITTSNVNINRLFFNPDLEDISMTNLHTIGEICDDTFNGLVAKFAKTKEDVETLKAIYGLGDYTDEVADYQDRDKLDNISFYVPSNPSICRYYEVWRKELRQVVKYHDYATGDIGISEYTTKELGEINKERIALAISQGVTDEELDELALIDYEEGHEEVWTVKYISNNGVILKSMDTPYLHGSHPYVLMLHTFIDGEIHPLLSDIVPQQKYVNRLIQSMDFAMGRAAKGVLLVPEDAMSGTDLQTITEQWSRFDGVIPLKLKPGAQLPQQVVANVMNFGANEMFNIQLNLAQQISGVNQAMQGQQAASGTPASRYAMETQNSSLNSRDLFELFGKFKQQKYYKIMTLIKQFYTDSIYVQVSGKAVNENSSLFDPDRVRNIDFDITLTSANNTPSYQLMVEEQFFNLLQTGLIPLEIYLQNSTASYAPKLLEDVKAWKQEAQQEAAMQQQGMIQAQQGQPQPLTQGEQMQSPEGGSISEDDYINAINQ